MITANVLAHTRPRSPWAFIAYGNASPDLITLLLQYPAIIHPEVMTHRVMSRNVASNRAIKIGTMIERVKANPFVPLHWGAEQPGMVANEEIPEAAQVYAKQRWLDHLQDAIQTAESLQNLGLHKQIVNRVLYPFQYIQTIVTSTDWDNFFTLRLAPDAEPHIRLLAEKMKEAIEQSTPTTEDVHLPLIDLEDRLYVSTHTKDVMDLCKISAARCARISTLNHETRRDYAKDIAFADRLAKSKHWSPFEHQAFALHTNERCGNFRGWEQARYRLGGNVTE